MYPFIPYFLRTPDLLTHCSPSIRLTRMRNLSYLVALCAATAAWAAPARRSFDYVIVGGGTAGLTVANRLSENPFVTVAVIEAGTFPEDVVGNLSYVPAYASQLQAAARTNLALGWGFRTTPQPVRNSFIPIAEWLC